MAYFLTHHFLTAHLYSVVLVLVTVLALANLLREGRPPASTIAWALGIVLVPYVGIPLYLLLGGRKTRGVLRRKAGIYPPSGPSAGPEAEADPVVRVLRSAGVPGPSDGNAVRLVADGREAYRLLLELIDSAGRDIDVATFILGRDRVGKVIVEHLARRAREGVRVRLMLDALGCFKTRGGFVDELRHAGGEVAVFLPVFPWHRRWSANLRNHRKIAAADGTRALVGGMNLAADYLGPDPDPARFHDAVALVEGPAVAEIGRIFASDWAFAGGRPAPAPPAPPPVPGASARVAVVASGPDTPDDRIRELILSAVIEARRRVWVATPYFVPDPALLDVLALRARGGCDIRVVVPRRSNHRLADRVRRPALRELVAAGAAVHLYDGGMLHAKLVAVDDTLAFVGSANFDMRSLFLNYELAALLFGGGEVTEVASCIESYGRRGVRAEAASPELRPWGNGLVEATLQTVAPLL